MLRQRLAVSIAFLSFAPTLALLLGSLIALGPELRPALPVLIPLTLSIGLLAALIGYLLAQALLEPLDELTRSLRYLQGSQRTLAELSLPQPQRPLPREVAMLRESFEQLLASLRELLETRQALYATLAHDLKTPLLAAMRALEYLEVADDIGAERRKALLEEVRKELERSYWLVENLLTASRLEVERVKLEWIHLGALIEELASRFQAEAKQQGLLLHHEGAGTVRADRLLLERAVSNLLINALRHARSQVILRAGERWIEVEDDGPGLPERLEVLSQPFRSVRLRGIRAGSAGLGLFIARRVAELHEGRLVECTGSLGGACLRLELSSVK